MQIAQVRRWLLLFAQRLSCHRSSARVLPVTLRDLNSLQIQKVLVGLTWGTNATDILHGQDSKSGVDGKVVPAISGGTLEKLF